MRPRYNANAKQHWLQIVAVLMLIATSAALFTQAAPVSESDSSQSDGAISDVQSELLLQNIMKSGMEDECEINSEKKDLCERCIRFVFERTAGYLGCCTNYDGIYDFCEKFLNYTYVETPKSKSKSSRKHQQRE